MTDRVDVMVDLETLDTTPTSIILSIGACKVNWAGGPPTDHFYRVVSVESNQMAGRTESLSTRRFWDSQPPEARKVFTDPNVDLFTALTDFKQYVSLLGGGFKGTHMWGNGSDFDCVILVDAMTALAIKPPWPFWNSRCFRTMRKEFGHLITEPERKGTHHNALDDAIFQAELLSQFGPVLRIQGAPTAMPPEPTWPGL